MHRDPGAFVLLLLSHLRGVDSLLLTQFLRVIDKFDDPETFEPERYLATTYGTKTEDDGAAFRDNMHFGPGCAINTMNMLGAFRFSKDGDETSQTGGIDLDSAYQKPGMVFSPLPFKCNVVVRDGKRARLIREWHAAETGEH
ncbi:hypothetical protein EYR38_007360 [Pleurotus pulmonarius]|nr:hypothetical protein EYR38_007360 [Pleurotus pulmonarius]